MRTKGWVDSPGRLRSRRRRIRTIATIALGSGVAAMLVAVYFVAFPTEDSVPSHADVAFVLGPPTPTRVAEALSMRTNGRVGSVLISIAEDSVNVPYWERLCKSTATACIVAKPYTTQGEARALATLAKVRGWGSAVVITQTAHITRARFVLGRCFHGTLAMRESDEPPTGGWLNQLLYQTAATAKAIMVDRSC